VPSLFTSSLFGPVERSRSFLVTGGTTVALASPPVKTSLPPFPCSELVTDVFLLSPEKKEPTRYDCFFFYRDCFFLPLVDIN